MNQSKTINSIELIGIQAWSHVLVTARKLGAETGDKKLGGVSGRGPAGGVMGGKRYRVADVIGRPKHTPGWGSVSLWFGKEGRLTSGEGRSRCVCCGKSGEGCFTAQMDVYCRR